MYAWAGLEWATTRARVSDNIDRRANADGATGIGAGRVRRAAPVAGVVARTAGEAVVAALRRRTTGVEDPERHVRAAERYAELLGRSKGALMKAGQAVSFGSLGPAVSPEVQSAYQSALARLRADAPPMAPELARATLEAELGVPAEDVFSEFASAPLAAASIGQVHAARLHDGRAVAVKIQYPGVAAAITADLQNTELLATFLGLLTGLGPRRMRLDLRQMSREIGEQISAELDYRREAANQTEFAELYRGHPFIRVPGVVGELSTGRVLTQELAQGRRWEDALTAPQQLRDRWAEAIHRFTYGSVNRFRTFNADPHPGNYLFADDGTVSFLDFGCVVRMSARTAEQITALQRTALRQDVDAWWRTALQAGLWRAGDPVTPTEAFVYWTEPMALFFAEQPYTLTPPYMTAVVERRYSPTGPSGNAMRHITSPPDFAMLGRMDLGVLSLTAELRATAHWRAMADEFYEAASPVSALGELEAAFIAQHPTAIQHA